MRKNGSAAKGPVTFEVNDSNADSSQHITSVRSTSDIDVDISDEGYVHKRNQRTWSLREKASRLFQNSPKKT